ncbi:MAG: hypothetical protein COA65_08350 [Rhodospirillaceae bacterium]|nr:MAG: hypothetical protein COA65_08350 [Rhodospirillaceae bacterium]
MKGDFDLRRVNFLKFGGTLALASMAWFVVLGTAHATLGSTFAKANDADGLALALQEICSATGFRKDAGETPTSPARDGLPPCTLCCSLGHLPLDLAPDIETPILPMATALPSASVDKRAADSLRTGLPPSRAPPSFLF